MSFNFLKNIIVVIVVLAFLQDFEAKSQTNKWILTMTKESVYDGQEWRSKTIFPIDDINELWESDYRITNLLFGDGKWVVVMSHGSGYREQTYIINNDFPEDKIRQLSDSSYKITDIAYGQNKWIVVMSVDSKPESQHLLIRPDYPEQEINKALTEGFGISTLAYGNNKWIAIISKNTTNQTQTVLSRASLPLDEIKEIWNENLKINAFTYGNNKWISILSTETKYGLQSLISRSYFPKKEIQQLWQEGYRITNFSFGACIEDHSIFEVRQPILTNTEEFKPLKIDTLSAFDSIPKIWAVIVGVAKYNHIQSLDFSDDDAYKIYAFFKSPEGGALPDEQIQILIDESATRSKILQSMRSTFSKAGKNDVVIFYFSGHGVRDAFLPYDYDGTYISLLHQKIIDELKNSPAKHKLCIADACHSGNLLSRRKNQYNNLYDAFLKSGGGLALMMSSKAQETSIEFSGIRQGVFSYYLIEGLKGKADLDNNKIITILEIFNFIKSNVTTYTKHHQNPVLSGSFDSKMPVGMVR